MLERESRKYPSCSLRKRAKRHRGCRLSICRRRLDRPHLSLNLGRTREALPRDGAVLAALLVELVLRVSVPLLGVEVARAPVAEVQGARAGCQTTTLGFNSRSKLGNDREAVLERNEAVREAGTVVVFRVVIRELPVRIPQRAVNLRCSLQPGEHQRYRAQPA